MANISKIKTPDGTSYNLKDSISGYTTNTGTVTKVSTGAGLTGGDVTTTGTIKCDLKSETKSTLTATSMGSTTSRQYAVGLDKNGDLSVNIPWKETAIISNNDITFSATISDTSVEWEASLVNDYQAPITGGASTITSNNLTASRALISNSNGKVASSAVTSTELGYLDGVTSAIQTQIDGKQNTITGAATTVTSSNLTASRALISNSNGKIAASSSITTTELGYLDGVTSNIQTQLDGKVSKSGDTMTGNLAISKDAGRVYVDNNLVTLGTTSNNGVASDTYAGMYTRDSADATIGEFNTLATTAGAVVSRVIARNKKTDGTAVSCTMSSQVKKDGTALISLGGTDCTYSIGSKENFRSALSLGSMATENTSSYQTALSTATSTTGTNGFVLRKYGNVVEMRGNGVKGGSLGTVPSAYRPKTATHYFPAVVLGTGDKWYFGWLGIETGGAITLRYVSSYGSSATEITSNTSFSVYGVATWVV